jgi:hypothetical protein
MGGCVTHRIKHMDMIIPAIHRCVARSPLCRESINCVTNGLSAWSNCATNTGGLWSRSSAIISRAIDNLCSDNGIVHRFSTAGSMKWATSVLSVTRDEFLGNVVTIPTRLSPILAY